MPEIHIAVRENIASQTDHTVYICGSGDYTAIFQFEEQWQKEDLKTARFQTESICQDVLFRGDRCPVPVFISARKLEVGLFAGNLRTTTGARIALREGIRSAWGPPEDPAPSLYDQLVEAVEDTGLTLERVQDGVVLTVRFRGGEKKAFLRHSEVYVGSGPMPEGYWVQVDPSEENPQLLVRASDGRIVQIPAIQGPKGEKGEKGDKGDPGPQGPRGDVGADVVRSVNGQLPTGNGALTLRAADIGALALSGGTLTGTVDMGGNQLKNLKAPQSPADGATKAYVDAKRLAFTATLGTDWAGTGPYIQTAAVSGILETDTPHVSPVYSDDAALAAAQMEAWSCVSVGKAAAEGIVFTCLDSKPGTEIPIQIEVMR